MTYQEELDRINKDDHEQRRYIKLRMLKNKRVKQITQLIIGTISTGMYRNDSPVSLDAHTYTFVIIDELVDEIPDIINHIPSILENIIEMTSMTIYKLSDNKVTITINTALTNLDGVDTLFHSRCVPTSDIPQKRRLSR